MSAFDNVVMHPSQDGRAFQTRHYPASPPPSSDRPDEPLADPLRDPGRPTYRFSNYADASTQYSPDGSPPTAPKDHQSTSRGVQKKRKQHNEEHDTVMDTRSSSLPRAGSVTGTGSGEAQPGISKSPLAHAPGAAVTGADENVAAVSETEPPIRSAASVQRDAADSLEPTSTVATVSKRSKSATTNPKVMPEQYETCEPKDLGFLIANMLLELIRINDDVPLRNGKLTRFHSRAPPAISCHDYLLRLIQHATLSPPILLSMVYYIDRLCALYSSFTINSLTVHRFLITAATVASKGLSDSFWTNVTYARIGGISTSELATLELDFLQRVEFRIVPKPETLVDYYRSLVQRSEGYVLEDGGIGVRHRGRPESLDVDMGE